MHSIFSSVISVTKRKVTFGVQGDEVRTGSSTKHRNCRNRNRINFAHDKTSVEWTSRLPSLFESHTEDNAFPPLPRDVSPRFPVHRDLVNPVGTIRCSPRFHLRLALASPSSVPFPASLLRISNRSQLRRKYRKMKSNERCGRTRELRGRGKGNEKVELEHAKCSRACTPSERVSGGTSVAPSRHDWEIALFDSRVRA